MVVMDGQGRVAAGVPRGGQFTSSIRAEADVELADPGYPDGDWRAYGYTSDDAAEWAKFGFERRQADDWKGFGFNASEAMIWRHPGFTPSQARVWESAPVAAPHIARQWAEAGFDPEEDRDWIGRMQPEQAASFRDAGWASATAREWTREGFTFEQASGWRNAYPAISPSAASVYREQGKTPESLEEQAPSVPTTTSPNPLRQAGPFRAGTVTIAERGGRTTDVEARIVAGTLAVHKSLSGRGWAVTHASTGRSVVRPLPRKADAEQVARTLVVIDPVLFASADVDAVREAAEEKVFVKDRWLSRGQLPKIVSESVQDPRSISAGYVQHLLAHPIGGNEQPSP